MSNKIDDETLTDIGVHIALAMTSIQDLWNNTRGLDIAFPHLREWIDGHIKSNHSELVGAYKKILAVASPDVLDELSDGDSDLEFFKDEE